MYKRQVYFVVAPTLGIGAEASASLSLGLFEGCYMAEIFRAGIVSLPRAQWEAAYSLGFGMGSTLRLVILPQALRRVVAPLSGQIISLIKDSSLVSAIAVADLTLRGREAIAESFLSFEIWLLTAGIYLGLTLLAGLPALLSLIHIYWRCITALTLHADAQHFFGNLLFGGLLLGLAARRMGLGLALLLAVLAGTLGNAANALYRPPSHVSLGFSTAVFSLAGIIGADSALREDVYKRQALY